MTYGRGAAGGVATGAAILPNTADNSLLFALAAGLVAVGVVVMAISVLVARKSRQSV